MKNNIKEGALSFTFKHNKGKDYFKKLQLRTGYFMVYDNDGKLWMSKETYDKITKKG